MEGQLIRIRYKPVEKLAQEFNVQDSHYGTVCDIREPCINDVVYSYYREYYREDLKEKINNIVKHIGAEFKARLNKEYPLYLITSMYEGDKASKNNDVDYCEFEYNQCKIIFENAKERTLTRDAIGNHNPKDICKMMKQQTLDTLIPVME